MEMKELLSKISKVCKVLESETDFDFVTFELCSDESGCFTGENYASLEEDDIFSFNELEELIDFLNKKLKLTKQKNLFHIEINRRGIGEQNMSVHEEFDSDVKREEVLEYIMSLDCGYDDYYCSFKFSKIK